MPALAIGRTMRKEEIHKALMHPEQLSDEQLMELRETVARFPFFGAAQIALTRAFKARGDVQFTDQLSQASIYTGHRASLYHRLKGINATQTSSTLPDEPIAVPPATVAEETTLASLILENEAAPITEQAPETIITPEAAPIAEIEEVVAHIEIAEAQTEESIEVAPALKLSELEPLEAQFLVSAISTSIEMEVQPEHSAEQHEALHHADLEPADENSYAALIYRRAQRKHQLPEERPSNTSQPEEDTESDDALPAFQSTPLSHGVQRIRSTDSKQHQRDLIDRFIHTEPQIARGKAGDYPTGNLAKDSLEDDFSMVTETIAILFAKQGKLDKARKAFRKLMEQHPEKSIYFAAQLKNLEQFKK
jgi:hypothetical protein